MKYSYFVFIYIFVILSSKSLENQVLEIPLQTIAVKGIPKYREIEFEESSDDDNSDLDFILLTNDGKAFYNLNRLFLASLTIGSNNQPFNLLLDTGSDIVWVAKKGSYDISPITHHYNPSSSTTSKFTGRAFEKKYGSGSCSGDLYIDKFTYSNNRFSCLFGAAMKTNFNVYQGDGICGLARVYNEENLSFIHALKNGKVTNSLAFSLKFYLQNSQIIGKMILGKDQDFSKSGIATCPLITTSNIPAKRWACTLNSFGLKNSKAEQTFNVGKAVMFDTGTNNLILPLSVFTQLKNRLKKFNCGYSASSDGSSYKIVCNSDLPNFTLNFNGYTFTIPSKISYHKSNNNIFANIIFTDKTSMPIIGSPFFVAFHTLFDHNSKVMTFYPSYGTIKKTN
jgi:hypothetical protein